MAKLKVVSLDWDSSLSDTRHRHHIIDRVNGTDWDAYSLECINDALGPAYPMARYLQDTGAPWIITSGRSEIAREASYEWLNKHRLYPWHVYLCDDRHAYMNHGAWKALRLSEIQEQLDIEIALHIDDIKDVKVAAEAVGIPVMLTHDLWSPIKDHLG